MSAQEQSEFLGRLAKGIAELFGSNCEVTVHDLNRNYESTIVAIENGHVTGRHVGDASSEVALQAMKDDPAKVADHYSYLARTKDGRMIKSSTIFLRDKKGKPSCLFGINYDVTDLVMAKHALESALSTNEPEDKEEITITANVNDLLTQLIAEADKFVGKPVAMMSKEDKIRAIQFLNDKGAFLVKKAGDKVSRHYDISKYTLYNYMGAEG